MTNSSELRAIEPERTSEGALQPVEAALLQTIFSGVPGRSVFVDLNYILRYANREFLDFVGKPVSEVIGQSVIGIIGEGPLTPVLSQLDRLHAGETVAWEGWVHYAVNGSRYVQDRSSRTAAPGKGRSSASSASPAT